GRAGRFAVSAYGPAVGVVPPVAGGVVPPVAGAAAAGSSTTVAHTLGLPDGWVRLYGDIATCWAEGESLELLANMNQPIFCPAVILVVVFCTSSSRNFHGRSISNW